MINAIILFTLFININGDNYYQTVKACVFEPLKKLFNSTKLKCALRCQEDNCKAFQFDQNASICTLYKFDQVCQSNTKCSNFTIFINNRYNGMFHSDITSPSYQILKNVKFKTDSSFKTYVFEITDRKKARALFKDKNDNIILALGTYKNSKLIILKHEVRFPLWNNILMFLTNGICKFSNQCYYSVPDYKSVINEKIKVIGIWSNNLFDFKDFKKYILKNNWHILIGGLINIFEVSKPVQELLHLYGICLTDKQSPWDGFYSGNVCQNITGHKSESCKVF